MENVQLNYPITLHVRSDDPTIKTHREDVSGKVREYFQSNFQVPTNLRVLCFFDDQDAPEVQAKFGGAANRGVHWPIKGQGLTIWPSYMWDVIASRDSLPPYDLKWPFASVIYLHGSTCEKDVALTITFAHELQHFLQYANDRRLWAANILLMNLPDLPTADLKFIWDIPIEREARYIAKEAAMSLFGADSVRKHAVERMEAHVTDNDAQDWEFFQTIDLAIPYSVADATKTLVRKYKLQLKQLQERPDIKKDPDFSLINFDSYYWQTTTY